MSEDQKPAEEEVMTKERFEAMRAKNDEIVKDMTDVLTALFKKHDLKGVVLAETREGLVFDYEDGITVTQKIGMLRLAQMNVEVKHKMNTEANLKMAAMVQAQQAKRSGLVVPPSPKLVT